MNSDQKELFKLLCEFDDICHHNDIEYILAGGVALGTVRNGGFLPWDDDVDILITIDNYEKLDKVLNNLNNPDRAWVTEDNTPSYTNPVARYVDTTTSLAYKFMLAMRVPLGYHLEIFIMDHYPDNPEDQLSYRQNLWLYTELRNKYFISAGTKLPPEVTDKELYDYYVERIEKEGLEPVIAEIKNNFTKYRNEDCHLWCHRWSHAAYIFEDEWVTKRSYIDFEGRKFPFSSKVLHHMRENYDADWNIVPVKSKRLDHNSISRVDYSYLKKENEINNLLDESQFNEHVEISKHLNVERYFCNLERQKLWADIRKGFLMAEAIRLEKDFWKFHSYNLKRYTESFSDYFAVQFLPTYRKFNISVPLRDDLKESMFKTLVYNDRYDDACYFLELYREWSEYDKHKSMLISLGELKLEKYYCNKDKVKTYLDELKDKYGMQDQIEVERTSLWLMANDEQPDENSIEVLIDGIVNVDDYEVKKYIGDMYHHIDKDAIAENYYDEVRKKSRNGMILNDL